MYYVSAPICYGMRSVKSQTKILPNTFKFYAYFSSHPQLSHGSETPEEAPFNP